jgi:hypothetical protein
LLELSYLDLKYSINGTETISQHDDIAIGIIEALPISNMTINASNEIIAPKNIIAGNITNHSHAESPPVNLKFGKPVSTFLRFQRMNFIMTPNAKLSGD